MWWPNIISLINILSLRYKLLDWLSVSDLKFPQLMVRILQRKLFFNRHHPVEKYVTKPENHSFTMISGLINFILKFNISPIDASDDLQYYVQFK